MGKQINYWMDYDNFILLAKKALELGCVICRRHTDEEYGSQFCKGKMAEGYKLAASL